MKIRNRTKAILRFKTAEGSVNLSTGISTITKEQFVAMKAHPMYEAYSKTSQLEIISEKEEAKKETKEDGIDFGDIDLEKQSKETLIDLAKSLEIETKELSKKQLIEAINSKK